MNIPTPDGKTIQIKVEPPHKCMKVSFFTGVATLCLGFFCCYELQKTVASHANMNYPRSMNMFVSGIAALAFSYVITLDDAKLCEEELTDKFEHVIKIKS